MGKKGERGRETSMCERNNGCYWLPLPGPQLGTWPATQVRGLTGNQIRNLLVCRPGAQSTEPHQPELHAIFERITPHP